MALWEALQLRQLYVTDTVLSRGAEAAAKEMGVSDVQMNYYYTGTFDATQKLRHWQQPGIRMEQRLFLHVDPVLVSLLWQQLMLLHPASLLA